MPPGSRVLLPLCMAALLALAYGPGLDGPFVYDDLHAIVENERVHDLSRPLRVLRSGQQETRPVYMLSLALNHAAGGLDPAGYRLVNLALHLGCSLLLLSIARRLAPGRPGLPECAALVFLLHPVATEGVAYVNSRSGLLAAAFGLAGMRLMLAALDAQAAGASRSRAARAAGAIACTALAMGSKESAVVFPALLGLALALTAERGALREALRRPWALPAMAACTLLVPLWFVIFRSPHEQTIGSAELPFVDHLLTQPRVLAAMLGLMVWPARLNIDHDLPLSRGFDAEVALALLLVAALVGGALGLRRRAPAAALGLLWFLVALAPTNSLVPFRDYFAERHLYLPSAGFALVVAAGASSLWSAARGRRVGRLALAAGAAGLLAVLAARTQARVRVLADPLALWTDTAALSPLKARPRVNLALSLSQAGRDEEAGEQLALAVELDPLDGRAQYNLGLWLRARQRLDEALASLRVAVERAPTADARRALARTLVRVARQRLEFGGEAVPLLREALAVEPRDEAARRLLAELGAARAGEPATAPAGRGDAPR